MLKKYEYFCNLVNKMRLADKNFKKEQERYYNEIGSDGKARNSAYCKLTDKEQDVEQFLQKVFETSDFHTNILKEEDKDFFYNYQKFFNLCINLAKAEKKYWEVARDFNNRLIEYSATIKSVEAYSDAEAELNLFLNKAFNKWHNKSVNVEDLKVSVQ